MPRGGNSQPKGPGAKLHVLGLQSIQSRGQERGWCGPDTREGRRIQSEANGPAHGPLGGEWLGLGVGRGKMSLGGQQGWAGEVRAEATIRRTAEPGEGARTQATRQASRGLIQCPVLQAWTRRAAAPGRKAKTLFQKGEAWRRRETAGGHGTPPPWGSGSGRRKYPGMLEM